MWWQIKWARNAFFGVLPFTDALRRIKRRLRPYPTDIPEWTLEEGVRLLGMLREAGCTIRGASILEIGSGWRPIIPLLFSLAGARRVVMVDTQRLLDEGTFSGVVSNLATRAPRLATQLETDENTVRSALAAPPRKLDQLLSRFRMQYLAPCDLISTALSDGEFDVVVSRAVLEHVPPNILQPLLHRVFSLLRPGGLTCHAVDNSDHWSHADKRLSRVNFLRYSDRVFGFLNRFNPLDYQNRLRHPEYIELLRQSGLEVIISRSDPEPKAMVDLKALPVAARFQAFPVEDLARLDSYFVARRPLAKNGCAVLEGDDVRSHHRNTVSGQR
jgi:SAM-dependent methyltransferase